MTEDRLRPDTRKDYQLWYELATRWLDIDIYGHVNNVNYYAYFDTIVNGIAMRDWGFDPHSEPAVGLVVESRCSYFTPIVFPSHISGGLRIVRLGRTSVTYDLGIFVGNDDKSAARGAFTHVFVDRDTRKPAPLPERLRIFASQHNKTA